MNKFNIIKITYLLIVLLFLSFCPFTYDSVRIKIFFLELILPWIFLVCLHHDFKSGFPESVFSVSFLLFVVFFMFAFPLYFYNQFRYACFERLILNFLFLMLMYTLINFDTFQIIKLERILIYISIPVFIYGSVQFLGWDKLHPGNDYLKQGRIYSFFFNPNDLAFFTNLIFFLSFSYYKKYKRIFYIGLCLLSLFVLLGTKSGSGIMAFIFGIFLLLYSTFPRFRYYWIYTFIILFLGIFIVVVSYRSDSLFYRLYIWRDSIQAIKQHPIHGWGLGSFQFIFPYFRNPEIFLVLKTHQIEFLHPENFFIHLLFEGGVIYLMLFLIANFYIITRLFVIANTKIYSTLLSVFLFQNLFSEPLASFLPFVCYILVASIGLVKMSSSLKTVSVNMKTIFINSIIICFIFLNLILSVIAVRLLFADIYLNFAVYNSQNINFIQAEKFYKKSIACNYFNPLAHYLIANLYLERGKEEDLYQALNHYTEVENIAGNYLQVYFFKGIVFNRLGDKISASQYFKKAFKNDPYIFCRNYRLFNFDF